MPAQPDSQALDAVLTEHDPARVVVAGTDADLAAVVRHLFVADRLDLEVGYLPASRRSAAAAAWGLPTHAATALRAVTDGRAESVPLIRDDSGGVLLGRGELRDVDGEAYCDSMLVLRGRAWELVATPGTAGVSVVVRSGWAQRARRATGRAVQVGCEPTTVVVDGVEHPQQVKRWTWYRHTTDLLLVRR
ncbi:MAG: hypothetical protein M3443_20605 [Actinomycetota bacterium]|nr:hypothetical protein [Actinomycetota bacterium]